MNHSDRPLGAVLNDALTQVQHIVRSEARLAKTELTAEVRKSVAASAFIGAGVAMLAFSALFVLAAVVYALSLAMPLWAAALVVAVGAGLLAALFIGLGLRRFRSVRGAPRTLATLRENLEWARHPTR